MTLAHPETLSQRADERTKLVQLSKCVPIGPFSEPPIQFGVAGGGAYHNSQPTCYLPLIFYSCYSLTAGYKSHAIIVISHIKNTCLILCTWINDCFLQKKDARKPKWICLSLLIMCTGMCTCNTPKHAWWNVILHLSARCVATDPAIHHTHKGYIFWLSDVSHSGVSNHDKSRLSTMSCWFVFSFVLGLRLLLLQWQWRVGKLRLGTSDA